MWMAKFSKQLNQIELAEMKRPGQWRSGPGFEPRINWWEVPITAALGQLGRQASIRGDQGRYIFKILNCRLLGNRSIGIVRCKYCIEWGKIAWPMHKIFNRFQNGKYLKEIVEACPSLQVEFTHYTSLSRSIIRSQVKNVSIITTHNTPKHIWESTIIKYLKEK